jgi:Dipeptidyl aminopeptidases/acylaminoacyl-peptidases
VVQPHWAPDGKSVFTLVEDDGAQNLMRVPVDGTAPQSVTNGRRKVTAYDVSREGKLIVRASTPDRPYEIFAIENDKLREITKQTDPFMKDLRVARVDETKFKSADGTEIHGFIIGPLDAGAAGSKPPALLRPHGGPQSQYACEFQFEAQLFAANGYAVILPNPRGSTGRGETFAMGIYADWGHRDVEDDLAAVDDAIRGA